MGTLGTILAGIAAVSTAFIHGGTIFFAFGVIIPNDDKVTIGGAAMAVAGLALHIAVRGILGLW